MSTPTLLQEREFEAWVEGGGVDPLFKTLDVPPRWVTTLATNSLHITLFSWMGFLHMYGITESSS